MYYTIALAIWFQYISKTVETIYAYCAAEMDAIHMRKMYVVIC